MSDRGGLEPGFHPAAGWLNDPHGIAFHDGRYHLFFQHVPDRTGWQPGISWGHAVSTDLEHWTELPVALAPDQDDLGCWSGCLAVGPEGPVIFYTSVSGADLDRGRVRRAVPVDDAWVTWRKEDLELEVPATATVFRDPFVRREGSGWRMVVGAGFPAGTAAAVSFTSEDLRTWTSEGILAERPTTEREGTWTGSVWECPQLVEVDGRDVLVVSVHDGADPQHVAYAFGELSGGRFRAGTWRRLTSGAPYAASAFRDAQGRPAMMFWLRGTADEAEGWAGALSAAYLLSRDGDRLVLTRRPWSG